MDSKKIVFGIIFLIIFLVALAFVLNAFSFSDNCNVGEAFFELPSNYELDSTTILHKDDYIILNITNKKNVISVVEYKNGDLQKVFSDYTQRKQNENISLDVSNLTIDNIKVIKSVNNADAKNVHFWFEKNGRVYEIFSWNADDNFEKNVESMIKSMRLSKF